MQQIYKVLVQVRSVLFESRVGDPPSELKSVACTISMQSVGLHGPGMLSIGKGSKAFGLRQHVTAAINRSLLSLWVLDTCYPPNRHAKLISAYHAPWMVMCLCLHLLPGRSLLLLILNSLHLSLQRFHSSRRFAIF